MNTALIIVTFFFFSDSYTSFFLVPGFNGWEVGMGHFWVHFFLTVSFFLLSQPKLHSAEQASLSSESKDSQREK